jgi:hypothetical protein
MGGRTGTPVEGPCGGENGGRSFPQPWSYDEVIDLDRVYLRSPAPSLRAQHERSDPKRFPESRLTRCAPGNVRSA